MQLNRIHSSDCRCRGCRNGSRRKIGASLSNISSTAFWRLTFAFYALAAIGIACLIWGAAR